MSRDDDFANAAYIPGGENYPDIWKVAAADYRAIRTRKGRAELDLPYGERPREKFDLFHPDGLSQGIVVFVHGGYWLRFDKSYWSHLAAGANQRGWTVAMPSYDLCPDVRISQITDQIERAIGVISTRQAGPLRLAGHSAGGHLVARMVCEDRTPAWRHRVRMVMPISPLADLAPLRETSMNKQLGITLDEAVRESPVGHRLVHPPVHVYVGAGERPVFVQHAQALAATWGCALTLRKGRHHFDVIEALERSNSRMLGALLG